MEKGNCKLVITLTTVEQQVLVKYNWEICNLKE